MLEITCPVYLYLLTIPLWAERVTGAVAGRMAVMKKQQEVC